MGACCLLPSLRALPPVLQVGYPPHTFAQAFAPLVDVLDGLSDAQRLLLRTRFLPLLDSAEREGRRADTGDAWLYAVGFGCQMAVVFASAINLSAYIDGPTTSIIGSVVLIVSSISAAAMGMRERLKFRESAAIAKRLSSRLQRIGVLFFARAAPYDHQDAQHSFMSFIRDVETLKRDADRDKIALSEDAANNSGGSAAVVTAASVAGPAAQSTGHVPGGSIMGGTGVSPLSMPQPSPPPHNTMQAYRSAAEDLTRRGVGVGGGVVAQVQSAAAASVAAATSALHTAVASGVTSVGAGAIRGASELQRWMPADEHDVSFDFTAGADDDGTAPRDGGRAVRDSVV